MNEKKKEQKMQGGHKLSRQYRGVVITERDLFGLVDTCRKMSIMIIVIIIIITKACKLAPDIGHLSGKFEGFDWRILSLTGHVDWALPL